MDDGIRLAGPSREVPLASKIQFLFGGFYNQFGWFWFGFSSIHFRAFLFSSHSQAMELPVVLLVTVFPVIGLAFVSVGLRKGLTALRLLTHGIPAQGRLVERKGTNVTINKTPVIEMVFEFKTVDGRRKRCSAKTHLTGDLADNAEEPLVYDAADPSLAVLLDDLPGKPRINDSSVVRSEAGGTWRLVAIPIATLVLHVLWSIMSYAISVT